MTKVLKSEFKGKIGPYAANIAEFNANASVLIGNSMRLAAEKYQRNADDLKNIGHDRLAEQFNKQAVEALAIAEIFENAEGAFVVTDTE